MANKIYVGYDESNNNSIPEFHIFVLTLNNSYAHEIKEKKDFLKKGKERKEIFSNIISELGAELTFNYSVIFKNDLNILNEFEPNQSLKLKKGLILYSYLKQMDFRDPVDLFFDGYIGNRQQTKEILTFLNRYFPNVEIHIKGGGGDIKFPIINFADRIGYQFFHEFSEIGMKMFENGKQNIFNLNYDKRFYVKTEEFCSLLEEFRK